jgi:hypothetical protein
MVWLMMVNHCELECTLYLEAINEGPGVVKNLEIVVVDARKI